MQQLPCVRARVLTCVLPLGLKQAKSTAWTVVRVTHIKLESNTLLCLEERGLVCPLYTQGKCNHLQSFMVSNWRLYEQTELLFSECSGKAEQLI